MIRMNSSSRGILARNRMKDLKQEEHVRSVGVGLILHVMGEYDDSSGERKNIRREHGRGN